MVEVFSFTPTILQCRVSQSLPHLRFFIESKITPLDTAARGSDPRVKMRYDTTEERVLIHRRVNYDIETAIKRFNKANLPVENATRLITGE